MEKLAAYRARMAVQQPPPTSKDTCDARIAAEFLEHCKLPAAPSSALWDLTMRSAASNEV